MNIQIFGANKCFDTKKAERWFKERRIKYQSIDLVRYGMSGGEFDSVLRAVGGIDRLIDWDKKAPEIDLMRYMDDCRPQRQAGDRGILPGNLGDVAIKSKQKNEVRSGGALYLVFALFL